MNKSLGRGVLGLLGLALVAGAALRAGAQNAPEEAAPEDAQGQAMQCPMMEALGAVKLHADTPAVLLAQEEQFQLTAKQKQELDEIAAMARERAREVLSDEQRKQLDAAPSGALSPMQLARMQMKKRMGKTGEGEGSKGPKCPMCARMMQQRMENRQNGEQKPQQGQEVPVEAAAEAPSTTSS